MSSAPSIEGGTEIELYCLEPWLEKTSVCGLGWEEENVGSLGEKKLSRERSLAGREEA